MCREIIFKCLDNKKWVFEDVIVQATTKGFKVYINREDKEDSIICFVISTNSLVYFLSRLFDNATPRFTFLKE